MHFSCILPAECFISQSTTAAAAIAGVSLGKSGSTTFIFPHTPTELHG